MSASYEKNLSKREKSISPPNSDSEEDLDNFTNSDPEMQDFIADESEESSSSGTGGDYSIDTDDLVPEKSLRTIKERSKDKEKKSEIKSRKKSKKTKITEKLTRDDLDLLAGMQGKRPLTADDYVEANRNRKFRKLKKMADDSEEESPKTNTVKSTVIYSKDLDGEKTVQEGQKERTMSPKHSRTGTKMPLRRPIRRASFLKEESEEKPKLNESEFIVDDAPQMEEDDGDEYTIEIKGPAHTSETMNIVTSLFGDVTDFLRSVTFSDKSMARHAKMPILIDQENENETEKQNAEKSRTASETLTRKLKSLSVYERQKNSEKLNFDIPERLLEAQKSVPKDLNEIDLQEESSFIARKIFPNHTEVVQEKIFIVLKYLHLEKLEKTFIKTYRKPDWESEDFTESDLDKSVEEDIKYWEFKSKLGRVKGLVEKKLKKIIPVPSVLSREKKRFKDFLSVSDEDIDLQNISQYLALLASYSLDGDKARFFEFLNSSIAGENGQFEFRDLRDRLEGKEVAGKETKTKIREAKETENEKKSSGSKKFSGRYDFSQRFLKLLKTVGFSKRLEDALNEGNIAEGHDWEDLEEVEALTEGCIDKHMDTVEKVWKRVVNILSKEIGLNPVVRKHCRKIFLENAVLSTCPTNKGKEKIDWMSPFFTVKRLENKPLSIYLEEFSEKSEDVMLEQYALINQGLEKGLIERKLSFEEAGIDGGTKNPFEQTLKEAYHITPKENADGEKASQNEKVYEIRAEILNSAIKRYIMPSCEKYAHNLLLRQSQESIATEASAELKRRLLINGLCHGVSQNDSKGGDREQNGKSDDSLTKNIAAISTKESNDYPTFCAVVDEQGLLVEYQDFSFLRIKTRRSSTAERNAQLKKKAEDEQRINAFLLEHKPSVIVVGADGRGCDGFVKSIEKICIVAGLNTRCELLDPTISQIFERSKRFASEFYEYHPGLVNAISLARLAADPLAEIAYMASGEGEDLVGLPLHPEVKLVPPRFLVNRLRQTIVDVVNRRGVDINSGCLWLPQRRGLLEMVCGLGPKAVNLIKTSGDSVTTKEQFGKILSQFPIITKNSIGFIRTGPSSNLQTPRALDQTRILPEMYQLTKRILTETLVRIENAEKVSSNSSKNSSKKVSKQAKKGLKPRGLDHFKGKSVHKLAKKAYKCLIFKKEVNEILKMQFLDKVPDPKDIDEDRCDEIDYKIKDKDSGENKDKTVHLGPGKCYGKNGGFDSKAVTKFIVEELKAPFNSPEFSQFKPLTDEELFWLITYESSRTLRVGQILTATVVKNLKKYTLCQLNCNVLGRIPTENLPGSNEENEYGEQLDDKKQKNVLKIGTTVNTRVTELCLEKGRFSIVLDSRIDTLTNRYLEDPAAIYHPKSLDRYLNLDPEEDPEKEAEGEESKKRQTFIPRKIEFPFFQNVSRAEAEQSLAEKEVGALVVRPSSRGVNYLMVSWKVSRDPFICVHVEIREKKKTNAVSLGSLLEINNLQFEDLDEIYARFFEKMTARIKTMMSFRRFRFGTEAEVEQLVEYEKKENPKAVPYSFGFSSKHPGWLTLFYVLSRTVKKEYIIVLPSGYKFRGKLFKTPEKLVAWFKRNPYDKSPFNKKTPYTPAAHGRYTDVYRHDTNPTAMDHSTAGREYQHKNDVEYGARSQNNSQARPRTSDFEPNTSGFGRNDENYYEYGPANPNNAYNQPNNDNFGQKSSNFAPIDQDGDDSHGDQNKNQWGQPRGGHSNRYRNHYGKSHGNRYRGRRGFRGRLGRGFDQHH